MLAAVFDPSHYVRPHDGTPTGRPVYTPEPDSRLLHLGDRLFHRVMSTFAPYRFPGGPSAATRWTVRHGELPGGAEALVLLTIEEIAVNQLREPCRHAVRTIAVTLGADGTVTVLPHRPAAEWDQGVTASGDVEAAREVWEDIDREVKTLVKDAQRDLTATLKARLTAAGKVVAKRERGFFEAVMKQVERERDKVGAQVRRDVKRLRDEAASTMFAEDRERLLRRAAEAEAEVTMRRSQYAARLDYLRADRKRLLERVLPKRYALHGEARVYPIAVEIRLPGGDE
jgi:hypothetical protein